MKLPTLVGQFERVFSWTDLSRILYGLTGTRQLGITPAKILSRCIGACSRRLQNQFSSLKSFPWTARIRYGSATANSLWLISILIRIEFVGSGHRNAHGSKRMQDSNAFSVLRKN